MLCNILFFIYKIQNVISYHNPCVGGSNPSLATNNKKGSLYVNLFCYW